MSVVAIGEEVGTGVGLVVATLTAASVTLHVVRIGPGVERDEGMWEATDPVTGHRLTSDGAGGGGTEGWMRWSWSFRVPPDLTELDVHAPGESTALRVRLDPTPDEPVDWAFEFDDEPLNRVAIERVWASSIRTTVVPQRIRVWTESWYDSPLGPVRPLWTEQWSGCDIVWFQFPDDIQPQQERFKVKRLDGGGQRNPGVPLGGGSTATGVGLLVGFATVAE